MPTKTEAAEALYDAARDADPKKYRGIESAFLCSIDRLRDAAAAYRDATPDALPAEVQRVVEAAGKYVEKWGGIAVDNDGAWAELVSACYAYRSSQPEPLSARLARLKPGSVVGMNDVPNRYEVLANHVPSKTLFVSWDGDCCAAFDYSCFGAIISEAA